MIKRTKGGRPPFRAEYAPHISALLDYAPSDWYTKKGGALNTLQFLRKLADYLGSEDYAKKSTKAKARKAKGMQ